MADVKISELTALTTPSSGDELVVNDSGTTKKIVIEDLFAGDNVKAKFGASDDLQIWSDGAASHIVESGTGNLNIRGDDLAFTNTAANKTYLNVDAASGTVYVRHGGSTKLATTSTGIDVTGKITVDHAGTDTFATIEGPNNRSLRFDLKDNGTSDIFEFRNAALDSLLKIDNTGHLTPLGGVYLGGTAAANKLDDYEEVTTTLTIADAGTSGNTGSTHSAQVTKIGRQVTVTCNMSNITTSGLTSAANLYVQGLPFVSSSSNFSAGVAKTDTINFQGARTYVSCQVAANDTWVTFLASGDNITDTPVDVGDVTSGLSDILFTVTYTAA